MVTAGGVLVANSSLINRGPERTDISTVFLPANDIAESLGNKRLMNMVALGALLELMPVLSIQAIEKALDNHLPERHKRLLPVNYQALRQGAEFRCSTSRAGSDCLKFGYLKHKFLACACGQLSQARIFKFPHRDCPPGCARAAIIALSCLICPSIHSTNNLLGEYGSINECK